MFCVLIKKKDIKNNQIGIINNKDMDKSIRRIMNNRNVFITEKY